MSEETKISLDEVKELDLNDIDNYESHGMKCRDVYNYESVTDEDGNLLWNRNKVVKVGTYSDLTFDEDGHVTKFTLYGDDILELDFYIQYNDIFLDKDNVLLEDEYRPIFIKIMDNFFGPDIIHEINFSECN